VIVAQYGCSPWSARCSDQLTISMVCLAAISLASAIILSSATPLRAAAHLGLFGWPSFSPMI
jgi:hypothetical protein